MISFVKRVFKLRIVRYGLVGGVGIPLNDVALFLFISLFGLRLYPLASACAFEVSNIVNFILNQFFTYSEQRQHIHGWEWIRRIGKGQLTSLSAMLVSYLAGLLLVYVFHVNVYLANPAGIVIAFAYNFFISSKLVFRPIQAPTDLSKTPAEPQEEAPVETSV